MPKSLPIHDIAIQVRENEIVLATHARSIYVSKLDDVQKLLTDSSFRQKKQADADKAMATVQGLNVVELFKRDDVTNAAGSVDRPDNKKKKAAKAVQ
jgi:hypothetical protein